MNIDTNLLRRVDFKALVQKRIQTFWGYGSLDAPVWFVGMEEGVHHKETAEEFTERFKATAGKATVDIRKDMRAVPNHTQWFIPHPKIQPTWKYLIALFLYLQSGTKPTTEEIRTYQEKRLGDTMLKETALLELMPLPASSLKKKAWLYATLGIPELTTRDVYLAQYKQERVNKLQLLIQKHQPNIVVFYSLMYQPDWESVIGREVDEVSKDMYFVHKEHTSFCVIPQSAMPGMSYARLYEFADLVKSKHPSI